MTLSSGHIDEPALDSSGHLKDASEIDFYNSESDIVPLHKKPSASLSIWTSWSWLYISFLIAQAPRRSTRVTAGNLDALLDAEKRNSDGEVESKLAAFRKPRKSKTKSKHVRGHSEDNTDKEDFNFNMDTDSSSEGDDISVEEDNDTVTISNTEVRKFYDFEIV